MEHLNKVELAGIVGSIRQTAIENATIVHFALVTERTEGQTIEMTWHNVHANSEDTPNAVNIRKGDKVKVLGRIKADRYTNPAGESRILYSVVAQSIEILNQ